MDTKEDKLRKLLHVPSRPALEAQRNVSQEVYRRKLASDIARTRRYIQQATSAIELLEQTHGNWPETYNESEIRNISGTPGHVTDLTRESLQQVHLLAHYEVFKQMAYQPMKNDLIGIATALTLTLDAVSQQAMASQQFEDQNETISAEIDQLKAILEDYKLANALVRQRIDQHPLQVAELQLKIALCTTQDEELERKLSQIQKLSESAKIREDHLHQNLQKVVLKMYAMMDWENAHLMDEATFKKSIALAVTLLKNLVKNLAISADSSDSSNSGLALKWVLVEPGTAEERLVEVMIRNNILHMREGENGVEIRLRNYGLP